MIAHDMMHYIKIKTVGKQGWMTLNLDMSKAYDRVEWGYIRAILSKLGFNGMVINRLMHCVTFVNYKLYHSWRKFGDNIHSRELRQGDPLYFF